MTSTRLTQQNRSREWAAAAPSAMAKRCFPPAPLARFRQLVARLRRRIQHDPPDLRSASYETHSRTRVGGWVLRCGCADPVPARSPAQGPRARPKGRPPPPLSGALLPALPNASDCRAARQARAFADVPKPASRSPATSANPTQAGRHESTAALFPPRPPQGPNPLSTRAVLAAPLSVTRDTRREGTRAPLLTPRCARRTRRSHNTH
jgi:hypothetical protein